MRPEGRGSRRRLPVLLLAWLAAAPAAAAVDPFYLSRLQEGIASYERKAYGEAVQSLRIACFGMLDEERELAACLARLALAQAGAGNRDGFAQTFRRLVEAEERVGLYTKAQLPPEIRAPFEAKVVEWIPRSMLGNSATFQRLAVDQRETQLGALAPKARRTRLAQLQKDEPSVARWPLLLARLEKDEGDARATMTAAERALRLDPNLAEARCLRGWARSETGKFAEAVQDLAGCRAGDPAFAVAELRSRVELAQWDEAAALLAALPAPQRGSPAVATLAKRLEMGSTRRPPPSSPSAATEARSTASRVPAQGAGNTGAESRAAPGTNGTAARPPATPGRGAATGAPPRAPATPPVAVVERPTPASPTPSQTPSARTSVPGPSPGAPIGGAMKPADETELARAQAQLVRARTAAEIEQAYAIAAGLAARYPSHPRVQHTAGEIAYRASRWGDAVRHFRQGGDPGEDQPLLLFYFAVALWETGARQEAAILMRRCEGKLRPTPFVQAYRSKILGTPGNP